MSYKNRTMLVSVFLSFTLFIQSESARILAVFPTPLISHQRAHRSLIHELLHRGHEIVFITPLPEYQKGKSPENLMEIDVSNVTKEVWEERFIQDISGKHGFTNKGMLHALRTANKLVEAQLEVPEVKSFIRNNETFDLLLLESWIRTTLVWTYIYDAPVISVSSLGPVFNDYMNLGGPTHPLLYPTSFQHEVMNLDFWQKVEALYDYWKMSSIYNFLEKEENAMAGRRFGDVPSLREQLKKIEMLIVNIHPVWEGTRPVPMNIVHLGATHLQDRLNKTEMTKKIKQYLDQNRNGVIYVSFGTNMRPWMIPKEAQSKLVGAFSKLPVSVLWKWDDEVKDLPKNLKVEKWLPQVELLKHSNVRLFVSQCGQQSIDEAIAAAVPVLALPQAADQWRNAEQLLRFSIGTLLDLETVEEDELKNVIEHTMRNGTYRTNMKRMRSLLFDAPAPAPVRAVDAIEYVLRHTSHHIASPTVNVTWFQYFEIELLFIVITILSISAYIFYKILYFTLKKLIRRFLGRKQVKDNFKCLL